jgi:lysyl-tRNA synthetase, class II
MDVRRPASIATALAGVVTVVSSVTADEPDRQQLLARSVPPGAQLAAHVAGVIGGLAVVWLATRMWRGQRRAARAAATVLGALAVVQVVKGLDYEEAGIALAVAVALRVAIRTARRGAEPSGALIATLLLLTGLAGAYAVTLSTLLVTHGRHAAGPIALRAAHALLDGGAAARGAHFLVALAAVSVVLLARGLLAPARARACHSAQDHARASVIVAACGEDSIAPFLLRSDKAFFFAHGGVLAYRTLRETAVVSGDPVGPPGSAPAIVAAFMAHAAARGWDVVLHGAAGEPARAYAQLGLRTMQIGLEAIVAPGSFDLAAPQAKTVRKAVHRVERHGWGVEVVEASALSARTVHEIRTVEEYWRSTVRRLHGFTMAHDRLWGAPEDATDVYALARDPSGELRAFQRYARYRGGLSLDAMRRVGDQPNGVGDALVAATLGYAREHGWREVSLNFAGFGHLMAAGTLERRSQRLARWALVHLHGPFQLERLSRFAQKFGPQWRPRYLVYTSRTRLPLAALRVMQAEAYISGPPAGQAPDAWLPAARPVALAQSRRA